MIYDSYYIMDLKQLENRYRALLKDYRNFLEDPDETRFSRERLRQRSEELVKSGVRKRAVIGDVYGELKRIAEQRATTIARILSKIESGAEISSVQRAAISAYTGQLQETLDGLNHVYDEPLNETGVRKAVKSFESDPERHPFSARIMEVADAPATADAGADAMGGEEVAADPRPDPRPVVMSVDSAIREMIEAGIAEEDARAEVEEMRSEGMLNPNGTITATRVRAIIDAHTGDRTLGTDPRVVEPAVPVIETGAASGAAEGAAEATDAASGAALGAAETADAADVVSSAAGGSSSKPDDLPSVVGGSSASAISEEADGDVAGEAIEQPQGEEVAPDDRNRVMKTFKPSKRLVYQETLFNAFKSREEMKKFMEYARATSEWAMISDGDKETLRSRYLTLLGNSERLGVADVLKPDSSIGFIRTALFSLFVLNKKAFLECGLCSCDCAEKSASSAPAPQYGSMSEESGASAPPASTETFAGKRVALIVDAQSLGLKINVFQLRELLEGRAPTPSGASSDTKEAGVPDTKESDAGRATGRRPLMFTDTDTAGTSVGTDMSGYTDADFDATASTSTTASPAAPPAPPGRKRLYMNRYGRRVQRRWIPGRYVDGKWEPGRWIYGEYLPMARTTIQQLNTLKRYGVEETKTGPLPPRDLIPPKKELVVGGLVMAPKERATIDLSTQLFTPDRVEIAKGEKQLMERIFSARDVDALPGYIGISADGRTAPIRKTRR